MRPVRLVAVAVLATAGAAHAGADRAITQHLPGQRPASAAAGRTTCPVPGARVSSGWGPRSDGFHDGVDLAAPPGTSIRAVAAGEVTFSATADPAGYGQFINITGAGGMQQYGHMRRRLVHVGDHVRAGQVIAEVGAEGQATGPHLHLRIYPGPVHTRGVDPARWLAQRGVHLPCR